MIRRAAQWTAQLALILPVTFAWLGGCSVSNTVVAEADEGGAVGFTTGDAAPEATTGLTAYCPSNRCPPGRTACPDSLFPCQVDLRSDVKNCGECGRSCPVDSAKDTYTCVDGRCVLACIGGYQDCDGLPDNGCETLANENENCGACGNRCADPAKPCSFVDGLYSCGCADGYVSCNGTCVPALYDDKNCGSCGNVCDAESGGSPGANAYYGCVDGKCGGVRCRSNFANCDGVGSNGCEVSVITSDNCGACGNACADGQECRLNRFARPECMCPAGLTFCSSTENCSGEVCFGDCRDLSADSDNCGGCGIVCASGGRNGTCVYGQCAPACDQGQANCNASNDDGCEVNIDADPMNCGGCGKVCDAIAGQACVGGRCVVEPCDQAPDAGVVTR